MSERLTVQGFAGLKGLSVDLRRINVLIGPQATGKSVVAKLLFFFKSIAWVLAGNALRGTSEEELKKECLEGFEEYFPPSTWGEGAFSVRYECGSAFVEVHKPGGRAAPGTIAWSDLYGEMLKTLTQFAAAFGGKGPEAQSVGEPDAMVLACKELSRLADEKGMPEFRFTPLFIPAGRSFFAYVQRSVFTMLSAGASLDPFLSAFGAFYERSRNWAAVAQERRSTPGSVDESIARLAGEVLGARHVVRKGEDLLEFPDGRLVDIAHASSGQQEALPLAVILRFAPAMRLLADGKTLYIEEPEAHLFPGTQRRVVELLATVFNTRPAQLQFVITTHSPYILTALNNLLQAGRLAKELAGQPSALERLHGVVPESQLLSADDVSAWYLDGETARPILSGDGLIDADVIDSVSEDLAIDFDKMLDIRG